MSSNERNTKTCFNLQQWVKHLLMNYLNKNPVNI